MERNGLSEIDLGNLRAALDAAREAVEAGEGPFGAVVAGPDGAILMAQGNATLALRDNTRHAESLLASRFCNAYFDDPELRWRSTLYSSMEPCAMCMFTMFKAGIGRVVYGLSADRLYDLFNRYGAWPRTNISSRDCARLMSTPMAVEGPFLEDEAAGIVESCFRRHMGTAGERGDAIRAPENHTPKDSE